MVEKMYEHIMEHIRSMPRPTLTRTNDTDPIRAWENGVEAAFRQILLWDYSTEPHSERKSK
jgi:hypothetical protein